MIGICGIFAVIIAIMYLAVKPGKSFPEPKIRPTPERPKIKYPYRLPDTRSVEDYFIKTKKRKSGVWRYLVWSIQWRLCPGLTITAKKRCFSNEPWRVNAVNYNDLIQSRKEPIPDLIERELDDVLKEFGRD